MKSLPAIELSTKPKSKIDASVLGFFQGEKSKEKSSDKKAQPPEFRGARNEFVQGLLKRLSDSQHFKGKKAEADLLRFYESAEAPSTVLLGFGSHAKSTAESFRQTGASLALLQRRAKLPWVESDVSHWLGDGDKGDQSRYLQAFCEGYLLANYEYKDLKTKETEGFSPAGLSLLVHGKDIPWAETVKKARILTEAVFLARHLGDRPGNYLTPTHLADEAKKMASATGLKIKILDRRAIEKEKMGLLIGVAKGSVEEPRFIVMEHNGGKKSEAPVALVGKGITFDSGGISIKPAGQMEEMKYDMMGSATVIAVMQAAARLKLPINIVGFVAAAENMPGGRAQKPGDVATSMSGKTVEITNTDAEGRLVLADALEYAQKYYNPAAIMDFATLTGAVIVALGSVTSGIMGTNKELIERIKISSEQTGERVWELPLYEEYEEDLKSAYADIRNSGTRDAGSSKGGTFLKFFIDSKYPWAHFDIAGSSFLRKDLNYATAKNASAATVRLMVDMLENWTPLKKSN